MQDNQSQSNNEIAKLLDHDNFQHDLVGDNNCHNLRNNEQSKIAADKNKKKGRPKGLKTCKSKSDDKNKKNSDKNKGHWVHEENKRYHWFLEIHSNHFILKKLRRMDKIFKTMSDFIGTRQAEQCRSHHQKMQKKFNSFYKILKNLRNQFYLSTDPMYVKSDLENHNITQYDPLISEDTLEKEQNNDGSEDQQRQIDQQFELELERNASQNKLLFSDHYEQKFPGFD